jgi:hypothetical protein
LGVIGHTADTVREGPGPPVIISRANRRVGAYDWAITPRDVRHCDRIVARRPGPAGIAFANPRGRLLQLSHPANAVTVAQA